MPPETVMQSIAAHDGGAQLSAIPLGLCRAIGAREPEVRRFATTTGYRLVSLREASSRLQIV
ncbi:hypothetical protein EC9_41250 [Rosistilla ulvae]|uniref:Uncharacterized protein n=1 Tax=Rosistilla ulvae TaxID=1930277 RepID=A0A517M4W8_9BACT|nr:hypothetical protein EC9_41250 [Rosistilla ulvae]